MFSGLTLALVVGVPAGSLLEEPLGFRGVFALVAAFCLLAALGVRTAAAAGTDRRRRSGCARGWRWPRTGGC